MTLDDVQAVLGSGAEISQSSVPQIAVAVNPTDEESSLQRSKREGTVPTARNFPTRLRHVVEGDRIFCWTSPDKYEFIYVAFKSGIVIETYYINNNVL
jgi:hypothetical protein